jgi:hypothetical protein
MWYLARFGGGPSFIVPNVWKQFNKDDGISKTFSYHLPLKFTMSKLKEQWIAIKFCVCFGKTATKTLSMMVVITFFHYKDTQELWKYFTSISERSHSAQTTCTCGKVERSHVITDFWHNKGIQFVLRFLHGAHIAPCDLYVCHHMS